MSGEVAVEAEVAPATDPPATDTPATDTPATDTPASEAAPDLDEITKNPNILQDAQEQMATLDVLVCGRCHSVFHLVEELNEHRPACTGKSPVRDSTEDKAQVWAFLLWKCCTSPGAGSAGGGGGGDGGDKAAEGQSSWRLYREWCRMADAQRTAWITAGKHVQELSRFSHATVAEVKVDAPPVQPASAAKKLQKAKPSKKPTAKEEGEESEVNPPSAPVTPQKAPQKDPLSIKKPAVPSADAARMKVLERESVRLAQERVPPEERIARRSERPPGEVGGGAAGEYVVEKILAKRFNPRRKQHEYLLKWEGYTHEQNTWEPVENMETCKHLLEAFEKQLARQKELKALRAGRPGAAPLASPATPAATPKAGTPQVAVMTKPAGTPNPALTPSGRLQRSSKVRAMDQVKAWCGAGVADEPEAKKPKKEVPSSEEDDNDSYVPDSPSKLVKGVKVNGQPGQSGTDADLVKSLGLGGKGMPPIKGVIKVDPKHMPSLTTGVYIMSKSSGIMKLDSPGKLGPGLNIDHEVIRKQLLAAKQATQKKKSEVRTPGRPPGTIANRTPLSQVKQGMTPGSGRKVVEKTIITPSGQKIIQRTIQQQYSGPQSPEKSPVHILSKKLSDNSLLRRGGATPRGSYRGRGASAVATAGGNIVRLRDKTPFLMDTESDDGSETSDGIEDPWPAELGPVPSPSPERELTLDPESGKRMARAEGEPTPPPTPSPPPTPPPTQQPLLMKVEMSPGGTTGLLVQGDGTSSSLPVLTDDETMQVECKPEGGVVRQLLLEGAEEGEAEGEEVSLHGLHGQHPIMIRGEDGVLYQVAGENEAGQTLLVAAEGVEGVEGEGDGENVMYVTREDGQDVLMDPSQLAQLMPGEVGSGVTGMQQVAVQVEGEGGEESTQVIAQLVQAEPPSPGGTRRVVLLLPDGSLTMTELDKDQFESISSQE